MADNKKTNLTKKPTGLAIGLDKKKFIFAWKIGDNNYGDGQQLYYEINTTKETKVKGKKKTKTKTSTEKKYFGTGKNASDIGKKTTSKITKAFDFDKYFPKKSDTYLNWVSYSVRGNREKYTTKGKTHNPGWSEWATKKFDIEKPVKPNLYVDLDQDYDGRCTFTWGNSKNPKDTQLRTYWQYQTVLKSNKKIKDEDFSKAKTVTVTSSYKTIQENITFSGTNYSYSRAMRVRACGPQGASEWSAIKQWVYAYPNPALNVKATADKISNGSAYKVSASWTAANSDTHPIDSITVKYAVTAPASTVETIDGVVTTTLSYPYAEEGWQEAVTIKDNSPVKDDDTDGVVFSIDHGIPDNQCIFVRVDTFHTPKTENGTPVISENGYGSLASLTEKPGVTINPNTNIAEVSVTSNPASTDISAAFMAVYYRTTESPNTNRLIGIIPAGQTTGSFKLPELASGSASLGVQAVVGNYTPEYTQASGSDAKVIDYKIEKTYMASPEITWQEDSIAAAPQIKLTSPSPDTCRVSWSWSWAQATGAELSWADHEDAWESTNEPTTYMVKASNASQWNISGLSVGTWYVRVRLVREFEGVTAYGPYSKIDSIKLASSPAIPSAWVSDDEKVITQDGVANVYWSYTSTDGTSQMAGEVCEARIQNDGSFEYGDPFASSSGTTQHIAVSAQDRGWLPNTPINKYYLTTDAEPVEGKTYFTVQQVETPDSGQLSNYYEQDELAYVKTDDGMLDESKTYYTLTEVAEPSTSDMGIYYELKVVLGPTTYYVAVRVTSSSGEPSEGWSLPVPITIAEQPALTIVGTSLVKDAEHVVDDETGETTTISYTLTKLPLTISTIGAGSSGNMTYIIERAKNYQMDRPDESEFEGFEGETIAIVTKNGETPVSIDKDDLIGSLDDGAEYNLIITLEDSLGQVAEAPVIPFSVFWEHQAMMPTAEIEVDKENYVTYITPNAPNRYFSTADIAVVHSKLYFTVSAVETPVIEDLGIYYESASDGSYIPTSDTDIVAGKTYYIFAEVEDPVDESVASYFEKGYPGDMCSIYRLSVDKPELIVEKGLFGVKYVDPYPTLGSFGGHRVVYITANGDYITDNEEGRKPAWEDYTSENVDTFDIFTTIIDFGNSSVTLPYDLSISNKWSKDFTETKYLGGSIQGDWNPAVSRSTTVSTKTIVEEDPDTIEAMRRLAAYPGVCHVRTPEGSSFAANVEISESREEKWVNRFAKFTLDITRVDSESEDGIPYDDWHVEQEVGE